jgi:hypothetical protein
VPELTRRELLESVTTATALGALGAALTACDRDGGLPLRPPPALLAKGLTSGLVWSRFCATLEDAGEHLGNPAAPQTETDLAEGYRMITRLLGLSLDLVVEGSDADRPAFFELQSATRKYAGDNPDQRYAAAVIAGDRRYRITGQRGNAVLVEIGVYAGNFSGGGQRRLVASLTEEMLAFAPDGSIEILLDPDADPAQPNQIRLASDAINVLVRQYFADPHDKRAHWRIERVPRAEPAPPLAADWLGGRLLGAALFVERNVKTWVEFVAERARGPANRLAPLADAGDLQTPAGVRYLEGYWRLAPEEALVLEFEPAPVPYWGFLIMNFWMESLEWRDRTVSLNSFQAEREPGGRTVRIVVAARDPGHPNWIDTAGHGEGPMSLRWARGDDSLPEVRTRVVALAELAKEQA